LGAGHTETGHEIDEALSILHRPLQSVGPSCGSHQTNEIDATSLYRGLQRRISTGRKIRENEPRYLKLLRVMQETLDSVLKNRIEVAEYDYRRVRLSAGDELECAGEGHSLAERLERGSLDGGAIGEGIAEGNSYFNDVGNFRR
jgi:hypothetical protein